MQIFIGNFDENISQNHLRERLEEFGKVESIRIENKMAFAEMPFENEAKSAILNLDKSELDGIILSVREARHGIINRRRKDRFGGRRSQDLKKYNRIFTQKDIFF